MSVNAEEFDAALKDFHRADEIEKTAGMLREKARAIILDYWGVNMDEFTPVEDGKTMTFMGTEGRGVAITVPMMKGLPSRFDEERTDEAFEAMCEVSVDSAVILFPTFRRFAGPDAVVKYAKECVKEDRSEIPRAIAGILMKFSLPATDDTPLTPRVKPVKGKRKGGV